MTRTTKLLLAVLAVGGALLGYWHFVLAPQRAEITRLDTEISKQEIALEQSNGLLAGYEVARDAYKANYATLARLGKAVPADDDVRSLLVQIDDAARRSGVEFGALEIGSGGASSDATDAAAITEGELAPAPGTIAFGSSGFSAMPFTFSFTGSFFELSAFFARLERFVSVQNEDIGVNGRLLRLESLQLQPGSEGFPSIQAEIGAATYLVPPAEDLLGGATPAGPEGTDPAVPPTTEAADAVPTTPTAAATGGAR